MRTHTTRLFTIIIVVSLLFSGLPSVYGQTTQARIKLDTDRTIGEIHPHLFGNFAEHLGRMIYGGVYEEGSPLSDQDGYRKDVMEVVKQLNVTILRWPGGNFASGYNWKDGIGPKDQRPMRKDLAWDDLESNRFGTDEFLKYCEVIGAEPYICINLGLGTIDEARHWVEYCNESKNTYWAEQRRKNGRDKPYNVKYWALGNEIDGPWQLGHKNAEEYSKMALEAAKAMRSTDSSIKLIASGSSNYGPTADWRHWNRTVLETLRNQADYIAIHTYIGNRDNDFEKFMASSQTIDNYIDVTASQIKEVQSRQPNPRTIYIAYDEWNVWYRAFNEKKLEEVYNFEDDGDVFQFLLPPRRRCQDGEPGADGECDRADHDQQTRAVFANDLFPAGRIHQAERQSVARRVCFRAHLQSRQSSAAEVPGRFDDLQRGGEDDLRQRAEPQQGQGHHHAD
jgi:alpha-L-arabinofuranosidase